MTCEHSFGWVSGGIGDKVWKIDQCSKCGAIRDVKYKEVRKQEPKKEKTVWDAKDLRITRMSVLKTAADIVIYGVKVDTPCVEQEVIRVARVLEQFVYEED